jgi:cbb3-type cytochrome oxidase maturation protein
MYLLIALSLLLAAAFLISFIVAIRSGQYDDKYTPSVRILFDDEPTGKSSQKSTSDRPKSKH